MFPVARAVLLSMRASEDFGCAEKLSAAEQIKPDCCRTPAVVSILLTPLPVSCHSTTPHHYTSILFSVYTSEVVSTNVLLILVKFAGDMA